MSTKVPRAHAVAAVTFLLIVNLLILSVMAIAPSDSPAAQATTTYKLTSLSLAGMALIVAIWRRWFVLLTVFAILQLASLFFFLPYVNGLAS